MAVRGFFLIQSQDRELVAALRQLEGVKSVYPVRHYNAMAMLDGESLHDIAQLLTEIKTLPSVSGIAAWFIFQA